MTDEYVPTEADYQHYLDTYVAEAKKTPGFTATPLYDQIISTLREARDKGYRRFVFENIPRLEQELECEIDLDLPED